MPLEIDEGLLDEMRELSGGIEVEVRGADAELVHQGLRRAQQYLWRIPHPDQPDEPCPSFVSEPEDSALGTGFWFDMADAETEEGLLERALLAVVTALDESGVTDAVVTWPTSAAQRRRPWDPSRDGRFVDDWDAHLERITDPPPPAPAQPRAPQRPVAEGGWSQRCPPLTPRRSLGAVAGPDGRVYTVGGGGDVPVKTVEAYDPVSDEWSRVASLRIARRGPGVAAGPDGRIYAVGGFDSGRAPGTSASDPERTGRRDGRATVEAYDPGTDRWELVAPVSNPYAMDEMLACTGADGHVYAYANAGTAPFERYDVASDVWTPLAAPPLPDEAGLEGLVALDDGRLVAVGTVAGDWPRGELDMFARAYDPASDTWHHLEPPHVPRMFYATAVGPDGRIYVAGGWQGFDAPTATVEAYDVTAGTWQASDPLPGPRFLAASATGLDGVLYVISPEHLDAYRPA